VGHIRVRTDHSRNDQDPTGGRKCDYVDALVGEAVDDLLSSRAVSERVVERCCNDSVLPHIPECAVLNEEERGAT
jgi:hypothetical protein